MNVNREKLPRQLLYAFLIIASIVSLINGATTDHFIGVLAVILIMLIYLLWPIVSKHYFEESQ